MDRSDEGRSWTLLTTHGRVLIEIARAPDIRIREIAAVVGITERAAQAIVTDLEGAGYVTRTRVGRRNRYTVDPDMPFRHSAQADRRVGDLFALFGGPVERASGKIAPTPGPGGAPRISDHRPRDVGARSTPEPDLSSIELD